MEHAPGTPGARFILLMDALDERFPDPLPCSGELPERRVLQSIDRLLAAGDPDALPKPLHFTVLLRCPCCGHVPDVSNYIDSVHPTTRTRDRWIASCLESEGGCGLSITGNSRDEVFAKWNRRNLLALTQAQKAVIDGLVRDDAPALHVARQERIAERWAHKLGSIATMHAPEDPGLARVLSEAAQALRDGARLFEPKFPEQIMDALDAIANQGLDARQCRDLAEVTLASVGNVED